MKLKKIASITELSRLARSDKNYEKLAIVSASNLGGGTLNLGGAINWLNITADETSEEGVIEEINFCRDLVA